MSTIASIDLNKINFFQPVAGKTLREQLQGKTLAGAEVVDYIRSLGKGKGSFTAPTHWRKYPRSRSGFVYGFSLTHLAPRYDGGDPQVNGFNWAEDDIASHWRSFTGDPLDEVVGGLEGWCPQDWILIVDE
jgi:hypothetical protein